MAAIYKEADFPPDYREVEVRQIMDALYKMRSIAVTGLAGMGKSNVVRFIVSHPQVRARYLKERAADYAFIHIDCAALSANDEAEVLGEIALQLQRQGISSSTTHSSQISIRHMLREQILSIDPKLSLALVLDYFDEAAARLGKSFFNFLFHLRNTRPRANLSYIFVTRRPMGHLHELQELLDDECNIGPLNTKDALGSIRRDEARLGHTFEALQRDKLIACTGGHPGFLKNAAELLSSREFDVSLPEKEIARRVLRSQKVKNLCQELWNDLNPGEQSILLSAARDISVAPSTDRALVTYLEQNGILVRRGEKPGASEVTIFCPLFEIFVRELGSAISSAMRIRAVFPNQAHIETATEAERVTLPPKLFALLRALTQDQGRVLPADELIVRVYGNEADGVTNAALSQLVKRLRGMLDPHLQRMTDDPTYTCVETIRDVGYKLNC